MLQSVSRRDFTIIAAVLIVSLIILFVLQFGAAVQSIRQDSNTIGNSLYSIFLLASLFAITLIILFTIRLLQNYQEKILQAQAAERRTAMFAAALNTTPIGVMIRDMRQTSQPVVFSNQAMTDLTGYRIEDLATKPQGFLLGHRPDPMLFNDFTKAVQDKLSTTLSAPTYRKDGSNF